MTRTQKIATICLWLAVMMLFGCADAPQAGEKLENPFKRMQLVRVEGDSPDQWEIWLDTDTNTQILCHHSGYTGSSGGRSTSCVVVRP